MSAAFRVGSRRDDGHIVPMTVTQSELFEFERPGPAGLRYSTDFISPSEERVLLDAFKLLTFRPFEFHGHLGNRRVASFGWRYDYGQRAVSSAQPIPTFLLPLRTRVADFAGLLASQFEQLLVTHYPPGAGIGWHRDKAVFGEVIGVSFSAPCALRFRRAAGNGWERYTLTAEPRSIYLLQGPSRTEWEHSIPQVDAERYSVTFRRYPMPA
jgi:alkylated DNA repair dioxygenase AlkB